MATSDIYGADRLNQFEVGTKVGVETPHENRLVRWIQDEKQAAQGHVTKWRENARKSYRFRDGKQLSEEDEKSLIAQQRPHNAFNTAQKFIRFVVGVEAFTPEAVIFEPVDESDLGQQSLGEFVTRTYDWAISKASGNFERSRAFEDLMVTGMGWCDYFIDHGNDPKGLIAMGRLPFDEMWWPMCPNQNLVGTRWRARESLIDKQEALARWPDHELVIRAALTEGDIQNRPEASSTVQYTIPYIETRPINEGTNTIDPQKGKIRILEWQWFEDEQGYYFYDPLERDDVWLSDEDFRKYRTRLKAILNDKIDDYVRQSKRIYRKVFLLNSQHQLGEPLKLPSPRFTFNCMTGHYDEEEKVHYGLMKVLIDPQRYANKFFNQTLEIIGHSAKGGLLVEEGAIEARQIQDLRDNYAKPGTVNIVAPGAISQNKIKDKPNPQLPAASMTIMQFCINAMSDVTGISPENAFGQGANNVPGVTLKQKQKSGLLLLAQEFESLSRFRIEEGHIIFDLLKLLSDDRLIRVGKPFESQVVKLMRQPFVKEYELNLDDTERDPNIRHQYAESVMMIAPTLIRMNKFIPELLDYFPLPVRIREVIKKAIRQTEQNERAMAQKGIQRGGRGSPVTPEERKAKVAKIMADTGVQRARASRMETQKARDQVKIILEALKQFSEGKLAGEKQDMDKAKMAIDLFQTAMGQGGGGRRASRPTTGSVNEISA